MNIAGVFFRAGARTSCAARVDFEYHAQILIQRQPKATARFATLWAQTKHYD